MILIVSYKSSINHLHENAKYSLSRTSFEIWQISNNSYSFSLFLQINYQSDVACAHWPYSWISKIDRLLNLHYVIYRKGQLYLIVLFLLKHILLSNFGVKLKSEFTLKFHISLDGEKNSNIGQSGERARSYCIIIRCIYNISRKKLKN